MNHKALLALVLSITVLNSCQVSADETSTLKLVDEYKKAIQEQNLEHVQFLASTIVPREQKHRDQIIEFAQSMIEEYRIQKDSWKLAFKDITATTLSYASIVTGGMILFAGGTRWAQQKRAQQKANEWAKKSIWEKFSSSINPNNPDNQHTSKEMDKVGADTLASFVFISSVNSDMSNTPFHYKIKDKYESLRNKLDSLTQHGALTETMIGAGMLFGGYALSLLSNRSERIQRYDCAQEIMVLLLDAFGHRQQQSASSEK